MSPSTVVSNTGMRMCLALLILPWLLITEAVCQADHHKQEAKSALERAKKAIIATFDPALPNLTLESFLKYETDGAPVEWKLFDCDAKGTSSLRARTKICVDIYSDLGPSRTIDIVLATPFKESAPAELLSVSLIEDGLKHSLKLVEIPAALHGGRHYKSRVPRDLLPLQRVG